MKPNTDKESFLSDFIRIWKSSSWFAKTLILLVAVSVAMQISSIVTSVMAMGGAISLGMIVTAAIPALIALMTGFIVAMAVLAFDNYLFSGKHSVADYLKIQDATHDYIESGHLREPAPV